MMHFRYLSYCTQNISLFPRECSNSVEDQTDNEESSSLEYNLDIGLSDEFPELETENDTDNNLPKERLDMVERHENHPTPNIEQARAVNIGTDETPREVKIGAELSSEQGKAITNLLREYQDILAWSYQDMQGLDTERVEHYIPAGQAEVKKAQAGLRNKVMKQWEAGFLKVVSYPTWLTQRKTGKSECVSITGI
jgi:hypothetical protein